MHASSSGTPSPVLAEMDTVSSPAATLTGEGQVALVVYPQAGDLIRLQLMDQAVHNVGLLLPLGVGHVDDVEQQVCVLQLLQGGLEGLHQLVGQLADKAHGVGDHYVQRVADGQEAGGGVQGIKQAVVGRDARPR